MGRKIDFDSIEWERKGILYRGSMQYKLEKDLITCVVKGLKPVYNGLAFEITREGRTPATFVTPLIQSGFNYAKYKMYNACDDKRDSVITRSTYSNNPFTIYPIVMAIRAERYRDRIYEPEKGEGIYIEGEIDADDIVPVFGIDFDNTSSFYPDREIKNIAKLIEMRKQILLDEADNYKLSKKSFLERYRNGKVDMSILRTVLFGMQLIMTCGSHDSMDESIEQASKYLEEFFKKSHSNQRFPF